MSSTAGVGDRVLPEDRDDLTWTEFLELPDRDRYRHAELVDGRLALVNPRSRCTRRSWLRCSP